MKPKNPKDNLRLNNLDKRAEEIGIGGNSIPNITEEKYRKRMEKRKDIQAQRVKERSKEKGLIIVKMVKGKGKQQQLLGWY